MTPATVEEAKAALRRGAWRDQMFSDPVVHSVMGGFGADWTLPGALATVENARELYWLEGNERPLGYSDHGLGVVDVEGRAVCLQAQREGDPLPDPPPSDCAVLDAEQFLGWLHDQVSHEVRRAVGDPGGALILGAPADGSFTLTWRGRELTVTVCGEVHDGG